MRILIQCVQHASVTIESKIVASIKSGELIFVGFTSTDNKVTADKMIAKLLKLRIFPDANGKTNLALKDVGGEICCVSQFTLYASLKDGNRPSFESVMKPDEARELFKYFSEQLKSSFPQTQFGVFQADMKVDLLNDGPFTIILDSKELGYE